MGFTPHLLLSNPGTTILILILFLASLAASTGGGADPIGLSGTATLGVSLLAYRQSGDRKITRLNWAFFLVTLS